MEMSARAAAAPNDAEKVRIREEMRSYAMANGGAGAERFFAGKTSEDAIVKLADKDGKPRLLLKVDANGDPSIEFLRSEEHTSELQSLMRISYAVFCLKKKKKQKHKDQ